MKTFKVGDAVVVERRFSFESLKDPPRHTWTATITRETKTRWVLGDGSSWIKKGTASVGGRSLTVGRLDARLASTGEGCEQ